MTNPSGGNRRTLYEESRSAYDATAEHYGLVGGAELIDEPLLAALTSRLVPAATVLDLGSGPGQYARALAGGGYRVVAIDNSMPMLIELRRRGASDRCAPAQMDMRHLGFRDASFDAVWAVASLIHVVDDELQPTLAGIHSVIRPGGLMLANFAISDKGLRYERVAADEYRRSGRFFQHHPTASGLAALLAFSGFDVLDRLDRIVEPPIGDGSERGRIEWVSFVCSKPS